MKKYIGLVIICILGLFITGCGKNSDVNGTISCISESRGENPSIISYEIYEVKNNKVRDIEAYDILEYDKNYLEKVSLDEIIKIYKKDSSYKVEKFNSTSIKNIKKKPTNVFKDIKTDDMLETIRVSMEENEFGLYSFKCEIK